jgi:hypothetical protein
LNRKPRATCTDFDEENEQRQRVFPESHHQISVRDTHSDAREVHATTREVHAASPLMVAEASRGV